MLGYHPLSAAPLGALAGSVPSGEVAFEGHGDFTFDGRRLYLGTVAFEGEGEFVFLAGIVFGDVDFEGDSEFTFTPTIHRAASVAFDGDSEFVFAPSASAYQQMIERPGVRLIYAAEIELRRVSGAA